MTRAQSIYCEVVFLLPSLPCSRLVRQPRNRLAQLLFSFSPSFHLRFSLESIDDTQFTGSLNSTDSFPFCGAHIGLFVVNHSSLPSASSQYQGPEPGDSAPQNAFQWSLISQSTVRYSCSRRTEKGHPCRQHSRMKLVQWLSGPWRKDSRPAWAHWMKFRNPKILKCAFKKPYSQGSTSNPRQQEDSQTEIPGHFFSYLHFFCFSVSFVL